MKLEESHACCPALSHERQGPPSPTADEPPSRRVFIILNPSSDRVLAGGGSIL